MSDDAESIIAKFQRIVDHENAPTRMVAVEKEISDKRKALEKNRGTQRNEE